jgi:hypothetical protein
MAASNTQFKVENGLFVQGTANVSGTLRVDGDLSIGGNLAVALNVTGDIKPTATDIFNLGSSSLRWSLFANTGNFSNSITVPTLTVSTGAQVANLIPSQNNDPLGTINRRWTVTANDVINISTNTSANTALANVTVSNTFTIGANVMWANQSAVVHVSNIFSVNTGSKLAIYSQGNTTYSNLNFNNDVTTISGNVIFDTDTFTIDAVNNRIGLKTGIASLSTSAFATVTGNIEFATSNTGARFYNSTATSIFASVQVVTGVSNSRFTFSTFDTGTATIQGGFQFLGTNATATQTLLELNSVALQYKSGNVAHSGNFGIYNVSGTRVGP